MSRVHDTPRAPLCELPKADAEFEGRRFWLLVRGDEERGRALFGAVDETRTHAPGFQESFGGFSFENFMPTADHELLIMFGSPNRMEGGVSLLVSDAAPDIGAISRLYGLDDGEIKNLRGETVTRTNLREHDGYRDYTGAGTVCRIALMQTFFRGEGIGSSALRFLQQLDIELIELEANGLEQVTFYERNGFVDTGIDPDHGDQLALVWVNPRYGVADPFAGATLGVMRRDKSPE